MPALRFVRIKAYIGTESDTPWWLRKLIEILEEEGYICSLPHLQSFEIFSTENIRTYAYTRHAKHLGVWSACPDEVTEDWARNAALEHDTEFGLEGQYDEPEGSEDGAFDTKFSFYSTEADDGESSADDGEGSADYGEASADGSDDRVALSGAEIAVLESGQTASAGPSGSDAEAGSLVSGSLMTSRVMTAQEQIDEGYEADAESG